MTLEGISWLKEIEEAAKESGHIWPRMAACEAALESNYGKSQLAQRAKNLFGMKAHGPNAGTFLSLPTKEFINGEEVTQQALWMVYATLTDCFADRMKTLARLAPKYPHYQAALDAPDERTYVTEVSQTWSTDPNRAAKVIQIYTEYSAGAGTSQPAESPAP